MAKAGRKAKRAGKKPGKAKVVTTVTFRGKSATLEAAEQFLPGVHVKHVTPTGPLEFRIIAVPGKATDGAAFWEIKARLDAQFSERFLEAARLLGEPVRLNGVGSAIEHSGKVLKVTCRAGDGDMPHVVEALVSGSGESHRLLGRVVTIERLQMDLPLEDEAEPEPVGAVE